jgi:hypothetical protein
MAIVVKMLYGEKKIFSSPFLISEYISKAKTLFAVEIS